MMDDGKYQDWFNDYYDVNIAAFAEKMESEFDDFCLNKFQQRGVDSDD